MMPARPFVIDPSGKATRGRPLVRMWDANCCFTRSKEASTKSSLTGLGVGTKIGLKTAVTTREMSGEQAYVSRMRVTTGVKSLRGTASTCAGGDRPRTERRRGGLEVGCLCAYVVVVRESAGDLGHVVGCDELCAPKGLDITGDSDVKSEQVREALQSKRRNRVGSIRAEDLVAESEGRTGKESDHHAEAQDRCPKRKVRQQEQLLLSAGGWLQPCVCHQLFQSHMATALTLCRWVKRCADLGNRTSRVQPIASDSECRSHWCQRRVGQKRRTYTPAAKPPHCRCCPRGSGAPTGVKAPPAAALHQPVVQHKTSFMLQPGVQHTIWCSRPSCRAQHIYPKYAHTFCDSLLAINY